MGEKTGSEPESLDRDKICAEPHLQTIIRPPEFQPSEHLYETANENTPNNSNSPRSSLDSSILIEEDEPIIINSQSILEKPKKSDLNDSVSSCFICFLIKKNRSNRQVTMRFLSLVVMKTIISKKV